MRAFAVLLAAIIFAGASLVTSAEAASVNEATSAREGTSTRAGIAARSMFLSPGYQSLAAGNWAAFNLNWSGYTFSSISFALYYEGGGSPYDIYTCWSNCSQGNAGFSHQYTNAGTRFPVAADQDGVQSNRVQVDVY